MADNFGALCCTTPTTYTTPSFTKTYISSTTLHHTGVKMNNFGVIELASAKTTSAPGWAYVPDTRIAAAAAQQSQPTNRKRARNAPGGGLTLEALAARQETKTRKEVEALDRDWSRDNSITAPPKNSTKKHTPNVRKILQSQKTFANHLDDFLALQALAEQAPPPRKKAKDEEEKKEVMPTYTLFTQSYRPPPLAHAGDLDPLLISKVPPMPTDEEMKKLLNRPQLSYGEATGEAAGTYPTRVFCEVCGYWGRVRCMKCGARVCALECLETHREECVTRYGL